MSMTQTARPAVIVLMGVSSSGKSTAGLLLSEMLGWPFRDADSFHPPANIEKMSRGVPLEDADRWPWLDAIGRWIDEQLGKGQCGIVSCSALKRVYRRRLIGDRQDVHLVYLKGDMELIGERMKERRDHFMPVSLLKNQFDLLEEPQPDEHALVVPVDMPPRRVADTIVAGLGLGFRSQE
jgi:carbohydrate kinase (thermoresistant glucokinase family)